MEAPKYQAPPPDQTITALEAKSKAADITATSATAGIDTASLMARFGTMAAMNGGAFSLVRGG